MQFGRYHFTCSALNRARLSAFKGSAFRGALGHALKKIACAQRGGDCQRCLVQRQCVYSRIFEPKSHAPGTVNPRTAAPPHPYVLEPPGPDKVDFNPGETFELTLLLFGEANEALPYVIYALQQMGRQGIGGRGKDGSLRFELSSVAAQGQTIYDSTSAQLAPGQWTSRLRLAPATEAPPGELTLVVRTPLRIKYQGRHGTELPFHLLVRGLLRRSASLLESFADGPPDLDFRGLTARALEVGVKHADLRWVDYTRYSSRQRQKLQIGGMMGNITYENVPAEYLPLLRFGREVHIGKQTTFGLGEFDFFWAEAKP